VYVRVDLVNDEPVATGTTPENTTLLVDADETITINLCQYVTDVETPCEELIFGIVSEWGGTVEIGEDGHTITFTSDDSEDQFAGFTYSVTDTGDGCNPNFVDCDGTEQFSEPLSAEDTITIMVNREHAPEAHDSSEFVEEDGIVEFYLPATDVDGDPLTFGLVAEPENGCIMELYETTGLVRYRPPAGFTSLVSLSFVARDGELESNEATVTIDVRPLEPGFRFEDGFLRVIGTEGDDFIRLVVQRPRSSQTLATPAGPVVVPPGSGVVVLLNDEIHTIPNKSDLKGIVVRGRGGNDTINVAALTASQTAEVYGEGGNDRITGGRGHDLLLGGDGNDAINGGSGDDLLIGGAGRDRQVGGTGNDLLLGGILDDPCFEMDLRGTLEDWRSAGTSEDRLAAAMPLIGLILDDGQTDWQTSGFGTDLFLRDVVDRLIDYKELEDILIDRS